MCNRMKTLLIIVSAITLLLFTSCEKDEMDKGIGGGSGGKQESLSYSKSKNIPTDLNKADDTLNSNIQVNDEKN